MSVAISSGLEMLLMKFVVLKMYVMFPRQIEVQLPRTSLNTMQATQYRERLEANSRIHRGRVFGRQVTPCSVAGILSQRPNLNSCNSMKFCWAGKLHLNQIQGKLGVVIVEGIDLV